MLFIGAVLPTHDPLGSTSARFHSNSGASTIPNVSGLPRENRGNVSWVGRVQRLRSRLEVFGKKNSAKKIGPFGDFALPIATTFSLFFRKKKSGQGRASSMSVGAGRRWNGDKSQNLTLGTQQGISQKGGSRPYWRAAREGPVSALFETISLFIPRLSQGSGEQCSSLLGFAEVSTRRQGSGPTLPRHAPASGENTCNFGAPR